MCHLESQNFRAQARTFHEPRPRRVTPGIAESVVSLPQPTDRHHITQRLPQFSQAENADFVVMLVIDINKCRALLPPKVKYCWELYAFVAGLETAAVPPIGCCGFLVGFDGETPEEGLTVLEGGICRRSGTGVAYWGARGAKGEKGRDKKEG